MIKDVIILYMKQDRHIVQRRDRRARRHSRGQSSGVFQAIRRAFPEARAARVELVDGRGERVAIAAELLPVVEVGT